MKRILCAVFALLFLGTGLAIAAPVNVPLQLAIGEVVEDIEWAAGLGFDYLNEREFEFLDADFTTSIVEAKADLLIKNLDLYASLGFTFSSELEDGGTTSVDEGVVFGLGMSAILYEWTDPGLKLFADAAYRMVSGSQIEGAPYDMDINEWHMALGVAKTFDKLTPYAGLKLSSMGMEFDGGMGFYADDNFGIFVGLNIAQSENIFIDLQARLLDDQAISVKGTYKF